MRSVASLGGAGAYLQFDPVRDVRAVRPARAATLNPLTLARPFSPNPLPGVLASPRGGKWLWGERLRGIWAPGPLTYAPGILTVHVVCSSSVRLECMATPAAPVLDMPVPPPQIDRPADAPASIATPPAARLASRCEHAGLRVERARGKCPSCYNRDARAQRRARLAAEEERRRQCGPRFEYKVLSFFPEDDKAAEETMETELLAQGDDGFRCVGVFPRGRDSYSVVLERPCLPPGATLTQEVTVSTARA